MVRNWWFFQYYWEKKKENIQSILATVFPIPIHHWELLPQLYQDWNVSQKKYFLWQTNTIAYKSVSWLFVTYREGFLMNTEQNNPSVGNENSSLAQQSPSSPLVFDSEKNK